MFFDFIDKNIIALFHDFLNDYENYLFKQCSKKLNEIISKRHIDQYILKRTTMINKLIISIDENNFENIAEIIYSIYKHKLKYSPFYQTCIIFKNHKWNIKFNGTYELSNLFEHFIIEFIKKIMPIMDDNKWIIVKHLFKIVEKNIEYNVKSLVMNNETFINILDKNTNLIGFNNGIYDLNNYFRIGFPTDYVSKSVGYNYVNKYSNNINNLLDFLKNIEPNETIRNHLLEQTADCLNGNKEKILILVGNKASSYIKLVNDTFGEYSTIVNHYNVYYPQDVMPFLNKRIVCVEAINNIYFSVNSMFNCVDYATHYGKHISCERTWKIIIKYENKPEKIEDERICLIELTNSFEENKKKRKLFNMTECDSWKSDFMLLLINIHKRIKN